MYTGKFAAIIEADIHIDETKEDPDALLSFEEIHKNLTGSQITEEIRRLLQNEIFGKGVATIRVIPSTAWLINESKQEEETNG